MSARPPQILAFGGGLRPVELRYLVRACRVRRPRVGLVTTAAGDDPRPAAALARGLRRAGAAPRLLRDGAALVEALAGEPAARVDALLVAGGNTAYLLHAWRKGGVGPCLSQAWRDGTLLAGVSAGAICWFERGISLAVEGEPLALPGLGLLRGSACPHYDRDPARRRAFHSAVEAGEAPAGWGIDEGAALHFVGDELRRVLAAAPGAAATRVEGSAATRLAATELDPLPVRLLRALRRRLRRLRG